MNGRSNRIGGIFAALLVVACGESGTVDTGTETSAGQDESESGAATFESGDGDGDTGDGDGDGATGGDGDGDGDGDGGSGDGDGSSGDGDGSSGDGDGTSGDGDGTSGDGTTGDGTSGDGDGSSGDGTSGDGDGDGDGDGTTSGDGTVGDGDGTTGDGTTGDGTTGDGTTGDGDGATGDGDGTTGDGDGASGDGDGTTGDGDGDGDGDGTTGDGTTGDGDGTTGDGDGTTGDGDGTTGDGDGTTGDGDGTTGDGDGTTGDGDGTTGDGDGTTGDGTTGDGDGTTGDGDGTTGDGTTGDGTTGDGDGTTGDGDGTTGDGDGTTGDGDGTTGDGDGTTGDGDGTTGVANEICNDNIDNDSANGADCADPVCASDISCTLGYNYGFEDWTASDPPTRWSVFGSGVGVTYTQDTNAPLVGTSGMEVRLMSTEDRVLEHQLWATPGPAVRHTAHAWILDSTATAQARMGVRWEGFGDVWSGSASTNQAAYQEVSVASPRQSGTGMLPLLEFTDTAALPIGGALLLADEVALTTQYAFTVGPTRDGEARLIASAGTALMHASFNDDGELYVSVPKGVSGSTDRFVFVFPGGIDFAAPLPAPWAKAGTVWNGLAGNTLMLADEGDNAFCGWFAWGGTSWDLVTVAASCYDSFSDSGSVLAGAVDARAQLGFTQPHELPGDFTFASVEWGTGDGSDIVAQIPETQAPANNTIQPAETVERHRSTLWASQIAP